MYNNMKRFWINEQSEIDVINTDIILSDCVSSKRNNLGTELEMAKN